MMCNTTEDKLGSFGPRIRVERYDHNCNYSFDGEDGDFDSDECSDDGESRHNVAGLQCLMHLLSVI